MQTMRAMLDQHRTDRRQLTYLVATEPATRPALSLGELPAAPMARLRVMTDDLIDLILWREFASGAAMTLLATSLSLGAFPGQQLLRFRARFGPPLLTRLGRILRRRLRTRPRVLAQLLL
jgi:hypothetical protein